MRNFQCIAHGLDVTPLCHAISRQPKVWNNHDLRRTYPGTPHNKVDDIWLRFQDEKLDAADIIDQHESINYPAWNDLPLARGFVFDLMRRVEAERVGRVLITRLWPGDSIAPHIDGGDHASYYDRYHIVLQGLPGSHFRAGDETVDMLTGEVWWFDNGVEHEAVNDSADARIHMIVDLRVARVSG